MKIYSPNYLILASLFVATPAAAVPFYELTITGVVNKIEVNASLQSDFDSVFSIGDPLSFLIRYDAGAPSDSLNNLTEYDSAIESRFIRIGNYDPLANLPTEDKDKDKGKGNDPNTPDPIPGVDSELGLIQLINRPLRTGDAGDEFNILMDFSSGSQKILADVGTAIPRSFGISLQDPTDATYPGDGTAPPALSTVTDFSAFTDRSTNSFQFYDTATGEEGVADIGFQITSASIQVVPEPTSLTLLGLGGILGARRRY
ncbi:MAG: PEP-CTERM sorting domain-containing protein [Planctomycetota bacterium]